MASQLIVAHSAVLLMQILAFLTAVEMYETSVVVLNLELFNLVAAVS